MLTLQVDSLDTRLSRLLNISKTQAKNTIELLESGASVPFIARYRKELTGSLDDTILREFAQKLTYVKELDERRATILNSILEQGKLTLELEKLINEIDNKTVLEDVYLPYKPKRQVKSKIAKDAGLEPYVLNLLASVCNNQLFDMHKEANQYLNVEHNILNTDNVIDGAKFILIDMFAENMEVLSYIRNKIYSEGYFTSTVIEDKKLEAAKFTDYFNYSELIKTIPSHRVLACLRGLNEKLLKVKIELADLNDCYDFILTVFNINNSNGEAYEFLLTCMKLAFRSKIFVNLENEILNAIKDKADVSAIKVFTNNLNNLLLNSGVGAKNIIGLDPGIRTGVKLAIIDKTAKVLHTTTIFIMQSQEQLLKSKQTLLELIKEYKIDFIAVGNGTASRETSNFVDEVLNSLNNDNNVKKVIVSEAGASVYSASPIASLEFPDLDVSLRGAVSIARRLQDPLAELVKIDPKSIGVGQYQHDVNQGLLSSSLHNTVEDCVNLVGINLNTASESLLSYISGLNTAIAKNIVKHRNQYGEFINREQLKNVTRLGEKTYEQCAGFLRVLNGNNVLDQSSVHPERYKIVELIAKYVNLPISKLIANQEVLKNLKINELLKQITTHNSDDSAIQGLGMPTLMDILSELEKPGRDPRGDFKSIEFQDNISTINDLLVGMKLDGVVTNVTNFGVFVDIGVHQDGLVHISELSNKYIQDPMSFVKNGDIVKVIVTQLDIERKRISLSIKQATNNLQDLSKEVKLTNKEGDIAKDGKLKSQKKQNVIFENPMSSAFEKLNLLKKH